ncbi:hypothetical protein [Streptomyces sp. SID12488]|uniref:hypothetical protein n=1 Tax=Streptomyces sp. SID12488 TaxID=2706040 RepID=UPI0013DA8F84|nr:hypothetical protein [Streptomyces sp. SID12488]NEA61579.1 hypothetical protein [Streptomyces sp. SID12488]
MVSEPVVRDNTRLIIRLRGGPVASDHARGRLTEHVHIRLDDFTETVGVTAFITAPSAPPPNLANSGREVTALTYDTGQATRARVAGLRDVKLSISVGDEPEELAINKGKPASDGRGLQVSAGRTDAQAESTVNGLA